MNVGTVNRVVPLDSSKNDTAFLWNFQSPQSQVSRNFLEIHYLKGENSLKFKKCSVTIQTDFPTQINKEKRQLSSFETQSAMSDSI